MSSPELDICDFNYIFRDINIADLIEDVKSIPLIEKNVFKKDIIQNITDIKIIEDINQSTTIPLFKYTVVQSLNPEIFEMSRSSLETFITVNNLTVSEIDLIKRIRRKKQNCEYAKVARKKKKSNRPKPVRL